MDQSKKPFSLFLIIWTCQMQKAAQYRGGGKVGASGGYHEVCRGWVRRVVRSVFARWYDQSHIQVQRLPPHVSNI